MPAQTSIVKKGVRGPNKPAKTPAAAADDAARLSTAPRTVRPRQLHVNDKVETDTAGVCTLSVYKHNNYVPC